MPPEEFRQVRDLIGQKVRALLASLGLRGVVSYQWSVVSGLGHSVP
jgi:hypothetical protein